MDGDDTPGTLNEELFCEGGAHDTVISDEAVRIKEGTSADAGDNDGETTTEHLGEIANEGTTKHSAEVSDDLGHGDFVVAEFELVLQHGRVEILGSVGLHIHDVSAK